MCCAFMSLPFRESHYYELLMAKGRRLYLWIWQDCWAAQVRALAMGHLCRGWTQWDNNCTFLKKKKKILSIMGEKKIHLHWAEGSDGPWRGPMIWGAFSFSGKIELQVVQGHQTAAGYCSLVFSTEVLTTWIRSTTAKCKYL